MLEGYLNILNGKLVKDDFIDLDESLDSQRDLLYDDMFQLVYENPDSPTYIIDVGWQSDDFENGYFICYLIKDFEWELPVSVKRTRDPLAVVKVVQEYINAFGH
jgi:hypothetical protein